MLVPCIREVYNGRMGRVTKRALIGAGKMTCPVDGGHKGFEVDGSVVCGEHVRAIFGGSSIEEHEILLARKSTRSSLGNNGLVDIALGGVEVLESIEFQPRIPIRS